jgi:surfeit locus 1 family protein
LKNYRFQPSLAFTVCLGVFLPVFLSLGFWQTHRAEEKQALMEQRAQRAQEPPIRLGSARLPMPESRYRRVEAEGEYDVGRQFLLDNQVAQGQAGYRILTPLRLSGSDQAVLVNRGWIPLGPNRQTLPQLDIAQPKVQIQGVIDQFPGVGFKLRGAETPAPGWPAVTQVLDADRLSERLGYRLAPYQVLLAPDQGQGYLRDWRQASFQPEKSRGYALQWFSFALALLILYVWHGFKPQASRPQA